MCCWMESHFHDWIYYSEVVFSIKSLKWSFFLGKKYWKVGIKNGKTHSKKVATALLKVTK